MRRIAFSLLMAALGWASCTMAPKYERPKAPVAAQYPGVAATNETRTADMSWSQFVSDPRLSRLIQLALVNNRDLRVAMLNVEQSRAQYRIARSALVPTINANGSYTRARVNGDTGQQWSATIGATAYEIDLWGRVRSLNRQALELYFASFEAQRGAKISLIAEVAIEYFAWRQAAEQMQLAQQTLNIVQESYNLNKAMFEGGASNELDLRTAEGQVQTAKLNVLTYERLMVQAENSLVLLIGQPLPPDLPGPKSFHDPELLADIRAGLPSELIQRRPDILEAEHVLKAANANIGAARAAFFPAIILTGAIGTSSSQLSQLFSAGTGVWNFSPQITLPIFTGGRNRANLAAAQIRSRIEVAGYERAIQTAFREVSDALIANSTYTQQIKEEVILITAQQRRFELANARYRQGEDTYLNVLSAQQDLYSAQQALLQTQFNKLASQISLYRALGGGWN